ncbi:complement C1q-like protein 3 isoform X2 [Mercenaria mercenaria]|uniref:complement C1q-like protein 3 isoform X2 n=1 Tax=Mercenaria mercenaria TaxID=6596 RepID=UPI00234F69A8|nr:complement C1q-like protein 3 isoform X2 [Mercenaria mercenaria]
MLAKKIFFVLGLPLLGSLAAAEELDRFVYEAKLLEKMIRMETKMERMGEELKATQTNVHTFIQNQTRILENKTAELELLEERVDKPMVAFSAYSPVDKSLDSSQILVLQTVPLNEGNGYDNVIGVFTAPVTGLYYFVVHACNYAGRGFYYDIILEHNPVARSTQYNNVNHDCNSVSAVTMVTAGQRVWVKSTSGNSSPQLYENSYRRTTFAGFLLQK